MTFGYLWTLYVHVYGINDPGHTCDEYLVLLVKSGMTSKNGSTKRQSKDKESRIKHETCYTYRDKGHLSKDCPKTQTFIHKVVNNNISHVELKNDTSTIKMISLPCDSPCAIWVPKHLLTILEGPNKSWVPKVAWSSCRWLEMHWKLDNQQEDGIIAILSSIWTIMQM
jgi:hypothetical protein